MKRAVSAVALAALCVTWTQSAAGSVLCKRKSGVVVVRDACKKKESQLDIAQFGGVQPITTFQGSWTDYAEVGNPAGYYKDPFGIVHLTGSIFGGTPGSYAFTLPPGYRG